MVECLPIIHPASRRLLILAGSRKGVEFNELCCLLL